MTARRRRMLEALQLRGLAPKTHACDLAAVHPLAPHDRRPPDQRSEQERRASCLCLLHDKQVAESTFRIHRYGMRFFDERTRKRQQRPVGLSPQEVRHLLAWVTTLQARMCLRMIYACGLRWQEGTQLQVADIDPHRLLVRVCQGTGGKDRCVPLAPRVREVLRAYWQRQRPRPWWFPARHQPLPFSPTSLQQTFTAVVRQRGLAKAASVHPRRPAYATHLWERGVSLRGMQAWRGHNSPRSHRSLHPSAPPTLEVGHATSKALLADR